jgi:hypothetical protein
MLISERHFCMRDCKMYGFAISMYDGCGPTRSAREAAGAMTIEVSYAGAGRICVRLLVEVVTVGAIGSTGASSALGRAFQQRTNHDKSYNLAKVIAVGR